MLCQISFNIILITKQYRLNSVNKIMNIYIFILIININTLKFVNLPYTTFAILTSHLMHRKAKGDASKLFN